MRTVYLIIWPYCPQKKLKLVDECLRYSKPKQCHFRDTVYRMTGKTISRVHVHVSTGSAETLARTDGITNHHLIAYSFSNISAKNYQNRLMCFEVTVCNISVIFFETQCTSKLTFSAWFFDATGAHCRTFCKASRFFPLIINSQRSSTNVTFEHRKLLYYIFTDNMCFEKSIPIQ